ncbi:MAG: hypothetical protein J6Z34_04300 [Clostridia bacterium]|nr:hypothetical protein [Clostridia bacterium]
MNSKQRVMRAFAREKSDRVPLDYNANPTIHAKIQKALGASSYDDVLNALNVDFRGVYVPFNGEVKFKRIEGLKVDPVYGFYTRWVDNEFGGYDDFCNFPLAGATEEEVDNFHVPSPDEFDYSFVPDQVKAYGEFAISCGDPGFADVINATGRVMGMEDTLVNLMIEDPATIRYIERRSEMELGKLERIIEAAKGGIDFMWIGEDLGTQIGPMISLDLYRKVLRPIHQKYIDLAKSYDLPVMVHSCGSSSWVYEDFIEMGVDAVDTLQPEAADMSPSYLVEKFAGRLSFHGCISTAGPLAYGSAEDVVKNVKETLEIMKPNYGYMLAPTHAIQDNTPVENVIAMYRAAKEYGKY